MFRSVSLGLLAVCVLAFSGCSTMKKLVAGDVIKENDSLKRRLIATGAENEALTKEVGRLASENEALKKGMTTTQLENARLGALVDKVQKALAEEENQRKELQELVGTMGGVELRSGREGNYIVMEDKVLFAPGKADLEPAARKAIDATVLAYMQQHPDQNIRIDGHTDGVPIKVSGWKNNYYLSTSRALAVMDYLASKGVDPKRIYVAGYGPNMPAVQPPSAAADVPKNRRVEILLIPKAGRGIDAVLEEFLKK